jgi:SAM-dependent methyltransferase
MKNSIVDFLWMQSFQPSVFGILINPFYLIRRSLYKRIKKLAVHLDGDLLDFGCGRKPYENLFTVKKYVGVDIRVSGHDHTRSKVDIYYDGKHLPFADSHFDSMIAFEVFEHIFNPGEILSELRRVLKADAKILISVPFGWNEHEVPYDYARYTSFGIKHLLEQNGFEVLELYKTGNFNLVLFQLSILNIYELLRPMGKVGHGLTLLFSAPLTILGILISGVFPKDQSMYFNSILVAKNKKVD